MESIARPTTRFHRFIPIALLRDRPAGGRLRRSSGTENERLANVRKNYAPPSVRYRNSSGAVRTNREPLRILRDDRCPIFHFLHFYARQKARRGRRSDCAFFSFIYAINDRRCDQFSIRRSAKRIAYTFVRCKRILGLIFTSVVRVYFAQSETTYRPI